MARATFAAMAWALVATACGSAGGTDAGGDVDATGSRDEGPAVPAGELSRAGYSVSFSPADQVLVFRRGGETLLRFEAGGFQLGCVDRIEDDLSYDPWFLYPASNVGQMYEPPQGLRWLRPVSPVMLDASEDGSFRLALEYPEGKKAWLDVEAAADGRFRLFLEPAPGAPPIAFFRLRAIADAEEGFYGLGGFHDHVNHRGRTREIQTEIDLDVESGNNEGHVRVPLLVGTRGWGLFVQDMHGMAFDVARQADDLVEVTVGKGPDSNEGLVFHLFGAEHPLDVTRLYYEVTGPPALPAPWALGPWIWRDEGVDQPKVLADLHAIRDNDLACTGYWIDRPYASAVNSFDFAPADYPDPRSMIAQAHDLGFKMALWHTPYVDPHDEASKDLYQHAKENGFFPPLIGFALPKWGPILDFTNPKAYQWWQGLVGIYTDMGIEGFKLDYAEEVALGAFGVRIAWSFYDGSDERTMHHRYQLLYHRVYAETLPEDGYFLLCRTGTYGDQVHAPVIWPGDLDAAFWTYKQEFDDEGSTRKAVGGLPASMIYGLGLGPSGFPFYGADTGGYKHAPPDKELFTRWFQQTALSSVMQVGNGASTVPWETGGPDGFDQEMLDWYRTYSRLHLRLFPYEWTLAQRLVKDGRPIQRPLGLAFPGLGVHPWDTYMFGDDLLVSPVVERGAVEKAVVFPGGRWIDWWDGVVYEGPDTVVVDAPLSRLPLYLREGGIVPMLRPTIDTLVPTAFPDDIDSFATTAGDLFARVFPGGGSSSFTVFDGSVISQAGVEGGIELGWKQGSEFKHGVVFEVVGLAAKPAGVESGGSALAEVDAASVGQGGDAWAWEDSRGGVLWVALGPGDHEVRVAAGE